MTRSSSVSTFVAVDAKSVWHKMTVQAMFSSPTMNDLYPQDQQLH
jgi:hypothetical protein